MIKNRLIIVLLLGILLFPQICSANTFFIKKSEETKTNEEKKWTLMMYDDADYDAGDILDWFAEETFSSKNINVLALQDPESYISENSTLWYIDENHEKIAVETYGELNMGNYTTLRDFILYCKEFFPSERYMLFIYGHGAAWDGCCDDDNLPETENKNYDFLSMVDIRKALTESNGVDCICFSAPCLMGSLEAAYELKDCTDVYIGSEETSGYPYWEKAMNDICQLIDINPEISVYDLGSEIINFTKKNYDMFNFLKFHKLKYRIINKIKYIVIARGLFTMSAIRTDKLETLGKSIDEFAKILSNNLNKSFNKIILAQLKTDNFMHRYINFISFKNYQIFQKILFDNFRKSTLVCDIYDFADKCAGSFQSSNNDIYLSAEKVKQNISDTVINNVNKFLHPNANGLSIFFPGYIATKLSFLTKKDNIEYYKDTKLSFINNTYWDEFLYDFFSK